MLLLSLWLLLMVCATLLVTSHTPHCCHSLPRQHHQPHHHQAHRQAPHQAHRRTLHRALRWPSPQPFHPPVCCDPIVVCAPQQHRMAHIRLFFQSKVITGYLRTDRAEHLASFFFFTCHTFQGGMTVLTNIGEDLQGALGSIDFSLNLNKSVVGPGHSSNETSSPKGPTGVIRDPLETRSRAPPHPCHALRNFFRSHAHIFWSLLRASYFVLTIIQIYI